MYIQTVANIFFTFIDYYRFRCSILKCYSVNIIIEVSFIDIILEHGLITIYPVLSYFYIISIECKSFYIDNVISIVREITKDKFPVTNISSRLQSLIHILSHIAEQICEPY